MIKITVTENNTDIECGLISVYNVNDMCFAALIPLTEDGEPALAEVLLYECELDEDGEISLYDIEDEFVYEDAADGFRIVTQKVAQDL